MVEDLVNHPFHYAGQGEVECKDFLKAALAGYEGFTAFCVGNIIKYCWRCHGKETARSLKSARWYFNEACDLLRGMDPNEIVRLSLSGRDRAAFCNTAHLQGKACTPSGELYDKVMAQMAVVFDEKEMVFFKNIVDNLVDCGLYRDASFSATSSMNTEAFDVVGRMLDAWIIYVDG